MGFLEVANLLMNWGLTKLMGLSLIMEDGQEPYCRLPLDERHQGAPGIAHGGTITALMDSALGICAMKYAQEQGKVTSTVEMKVNFLKPAPLGATLVTSTKILSAGRSLIVVSGEAVIEGPATKVAFATGTFNLYNSQSSTLRQYAQESITPPFRS